MKSGRHEKIIELVNNYDINTQEELLARLNDAGFSATQATISRDIKELRILKTLNPQGKYCYTTGGRNSLDKTTGFENLFKASAKMVDCAENIVVLKTMSGMAQAVCASLDNLEIENIVGTIAGDDTIFIVMRNKDFATELKEKFKNLL